MSVEVGEFMGGKEMMNKKAQLYGRAKEMQEKKLRTPTVQWFCRPLPPGLPTVEIVELH